MAFSWWAVNPKGVFNHKGLCGNYCSGGGWIGFSSDCYWPKKVQNPADWFSSSCLREAWSVEMFSCTDEDITHTHDITVMCGYWCKRNNHMHVIIFIESLTWGSHAAPVAVKWLWCQWHEEQLVHFARQRWIQSVLQTLNPAFVLMSCSIQFVVGGGSTPALQKANRKQIWLDEWCHFSAQPLKD